MKAADHAQEDRVHYPWSADRELTLEMATLEVSAQFPELHPVQVRYVGSGWDCDAYLVNQEWLFRFPRRRDVVETLERGIAVLERLPELSGVRTPRNAKSGRPGSRFPYHFFGYRWIAGCGADELPEEKTDRRALAAQLGATFSELHDFDPRSLTAIGIPHEQEGPRGWLSSVVEDAAVIRRALPADLRRCCAPYLTGEIDSPPAYAGPPRLIHNDIGIEHLIVDPGSGRLVGIIDWEDASIGDPAFDFVGLRYWLGADFVESMLQCYAVAVDPGFRERLEFLTRLRTLDDLGNALLKSGRHRIGKHVAWLRTAFSA